MLSGAKMACDFRFGEDDGMLTMCPAPLGNPQALFARVSRCVEDRWLTHDAGYLAQSWNLALAIEVCCDCRPLVEVKVLLSHEHVGSPSYASLYAISQTRFWSSTGRAEKRGNVGLGPKNVDHHMAARMPSR
jgi:hypothetical protein